MATETTTESLEARLLRLGGQRWEKSGMRRIYINGLTRWYGLETTRYNTGHISSATLNGERISNSHAKDICWKFENAKLYHDLADGKFHGPGLNQADLERIVASIRAAE